MHNCGDGGIYRCVAAFMPWIAETLAKPGRFRWDYRVPPQTIVSDGTTVWLYDEDLAQNIAIAASTA